MPISDSLTPRPGIIPSGYERTLPPEVQLVVRARRRVLARRARGRVLDLGGAETHQTMWSGMPDVDAATVLDGGDDPQLLSLSRGDDRFDTVVSVFQLATAPDLDATVRRVAALLHEDGRLLFLEPARLAGTPGRLQRLVAPSVGLVAGWRVDRDIPKALRETRLSVTDLARHRVPTIQWWLRGLAEGSAHHALPLHPHGPST